MMMRGGRSDFSDHFLWNKKNLKRDMGRWDWKIKTLRQKKKNKENSKNAKMKAAKEVGNFTKHATFL
jgi:hypothetical protein